MLISSLILLEKLLSIENLSNSRQWEQVSCHPEFHLKVWFLLLAGNCCQLFSSKWQAHFFEFQEMAAKYKSKNRSLSPIISSKNSIPWRKHLIHLITQWHMCFSWRQPSYLVCSRTALCIPPFSSQVTRRSRVKI